MIAWAAEELQYADLGDARLNKRLVKIVEDLAAHPNASVTEATENWSDAKAIYRFWKNEQVRAVDIIEALAFGCSRATQRPASDFGDSRYDRFKLFSSLE